MASAFQKRGGSYRAWKEGDDEVDKPSVTPYPEGGLRDSDMQRWRDYYSQLPSEEAPTDQRMSEKELVESDFFDHLNWLRWKLEIDKKARQKQVDSLTGPTIERRGFYRLSEDSI